MTLEQLLARQQELAVALANATNSVYIVQGHKAEIDWQVSETQKSEARKKELETPVEVAVD